MSRIRSGLGIELLPEGAWTTYVPKFVSPKRQTIRALRKRHARPGEELQLYCGMRTKGCFLIGRARCVAVDAITLSFRAGGRVLIAPSRTYSGPMLDGFARLDGFASWREMNDFWRAEHPNLDVFEGVLIRWEPIEQSAVR